MHREASDDEIFQPTKLHFAPVPVGDVEAQDQFNSSESPKIFQTSQQVIDSLLPQSQKRQLITIKTTPDYISHQVLTGRLICNTANLLLCIAPFAQALPRS